MKTLPLGLLLLCQQFTNAVALWPFPAKRFTKNALIDTGSLGLPQQSRALAFGDFNGDQLYESRIRHVTLLIMHSASM
jgi:integrin alpha FG-GAP repeat containing protein 1